jgi:hypothetical protein
MLLEDNNLTLNMLLSNLCHQTIGLLHFVDFNHHLHGENNSLEWQQIGVINHMADVAMQFADPFLPSECISQALGTVPPMPHWR